MQAETCHFLWMRKAIEVDLCQSLVGFQLWDSVVLEAALDSGWGAYVRSSNHLFVNATNIFWKHLDSEFSENEFRQQTQIIFSEKERGYSRN